MSDISAARLNMVESQIRPNKVTDKRILGAMLEIPRELFVPEARRSLAYMDEEITLGAGRKLIAPMPLARLVQLCAVEEDDLVLDVGCASGYSTAIFSRLAGAVVGLECEGEFAARAAATLEELGADNVDIITAPHEKGHAAAAPYDVIMLGGAVPEVPAPLLRQLKEGGRLVTVVAGDGVSRACLFEKTGGEIAHRLLFEAAAPPLPGFERAPRFTFV